MRSAPSDLKARIESDEGRNADRRAGDDADESFIAQTPADEPIDGRAGQRSEDD